MATEKNLQTIDLKIGSQSQLNENINTYEEGTLFGTTDLIGVGDLAPDLRNKVENNAKINSSNTFTESQIFNKDITINGNIIQKGDTYKTHAEELYTKKDIIFTREGAISTLGDNEYTGIQAVKYDGTNDGQLVFDKDGTARVGDVGDTQPLATRSEKEELVGGNLLQWDAVNNKIIDAGKSTSDLLTLIEPNYVLIEKVITGYTVLETAPEDFATNYASYYKTNGKARNDIDFNYVALTEAETFETGKYYSKTTEKANLIRFGESGKELDGTPYAFKNIFINFENSNTTLGVWDPIHFYVGNRPTDAIYYGGLGLGVQTNKSQVNADMQGNAVNIYAMALSAENNATKLQFRKREIISETNPVLDGIKIHSLFPDTIVLIYGAK